MTNEEETRRKIEEDCRPSVNDRLNDIAVGVASGVAGGAMRGAFTGDPRQVVVQAASAGIVGGVIGAGKTNLNEKTCVESGLEKIHKQEPQTPPPPPVVFTQAAAPQRPVNANANYLVQMQANRNRIMFRGYARI